MYNLYGRYIGKKIFNLTQKAGVPDVGMEGGMDYVPIRKEVIFSGITLLPLSSQVQLQVLPVPLSGVRPALIRVFTGSFSMGAVHDVGV